MSKEEDFGQDGEVDDDDDDEDEEDEGMYLCPYTPITFQLVMNAFCPFIIVNKDSITLQPSKVRSLGKIVSLTRWDIA